MIRHAIAAMLMMTGAARADVLYTFTPASYSGPWPSGASLSFQLTDAAIQGSTFNYEQSQGPFETNGTGLVSLSATAPHLSDFAGPLGGSFQIGLTFGPGGSLLTDSLYLFSDDTTEELHVNGTTAVYSADVGPCEVIGSCSATGTWTETPVPEPATLALFGAGLLLFGFARRVRG